MWRSAFPAVLLGPTGHVSAKKGAHADVVEPSPCRRLACRIRDSAAKRSTAFDEDSVAKHVSKRFASHTHAKKRSRAKRQDDAREQLGHGPAVLFESLFCCRFPIHGFFASACMRCRGSQMARKGVSSIGLPVLRRTSARPFRHTAAALVARDALAGRAANELASLVAARFRSGREILQGVGADQELLAARR